MEKMKNLLLIAAFTLCVTLLPNYVNAAPSATNFKVYCGSSKIATGDTTNCYLLAQINEEGGVGIHGVYTYVTGLDKLTIQNAFAFSSDDVKVTKINKGGNNALNKPCGANGECYDFVANTGKSIRKTTTNDINDSTLKTSEWQGYSPIAYWTVKLDNNATDEDCGKFCLALDYKATEAGESASGDLTANGAGCAQIRPVVNKVTCQVKDDKYYGPTGEEITQEEYKKQCEATKPPETGSFASYAVLAAGAFIALSAITIAKKHNKFYRV